MGKKTPIFAFLSFWAASGQAGIFSSEDWGTHGPTVMLEVPGVRALSLGGAYVAVADGADAVYWNPAGLQAVDRREIQFMHAELFADQNQEAVAYAHPRWRRGERETWGFGVNYLAMDRFDVQRWGDPAGSVHPREVATSLSYAGMWGPTAWGATGKWVYAESFEQSGQTLAFDAGLRSPPGDRGWTWGVTTSNLGPALSLGSDQVPLPAVLRAGLAWKGTPWGPGLLLVTGQADLPLDDRLTGRLGCEYEVSAGKEWRAAVRLGGRTRGTGRFSVGAGVSRASLTTNVAFTPDRALGNEMRFDVGLRFGESLGPEIRRRALVEKTRRLIVEGHLLEAREAWRDLRDLSPRSDATRRLGKEIDLRMARSLDSDVLFEKGREAFEQGDLATAESLFGKLLLVAPNHTEGNRALEETKARLETQRKDQLKTEVAETRQREKNALLREAERARAQGDCAQFLEVWDRVIRLYGESPLTVKGVGECEEKLYQEAERAQSAGDLERALNLFQAVDRAGSYQDARKRSKDLERTLSERLLQRARDAYKEGMAAYTKGDLAKAQDLFEEVLRLTPKDEAARQALQHVVVDRALPLKKDR